MEILVCARRVPDTSEDEIAINRAGNDIERDELVYSINEPRYVGMRGIRQVASIDIPTFGAADLGIDPGSVGQAAAKVKRLDYSVPALGKGARMLEGSREEIIEELVGLVKAKGGLD